MMAFALIFGLAGPFRHRSGQSRTYSQAPLTTGAAVAAPPAPLETAVGIPDLVFTSFGSNESFGTNSWAIGSEAHADWFVAEKSGYLQEIEMALAPSAVGRPGKATVLLARDRKGFPGVVLESFSVKLNSSGDSDAIKPILIESSRHPELKAGVKYWLGARSKTGWQWFFGNPKIIHNSAREPRRGHWASAGDYCYVCAFSVKITSNAPPAALTQPVNHAADNVEKH